MKLIFSIILLIISLASCKGPDADSVLDVPVTGRIDYHEYTPGPSDLVVCRETYHDRLYGFWLGQSIANWTGLITEMDKIGNIGDIKTGDFYTREDWGSPARPNIWGNLPPHSSTIDFYFEDEGGIWGADDDTDIEYMYQYLLYTNETSILSPGQIRDGWLHHIWSKNEPTPFGEVSDGVYENYLWVSNQRAYTLMEEKGMVPPETSHPDHNPDYEMIDAQLTTEIFGLFSPARPDIALKMAYLPIRTTARENAAWISEFYVIMHSLASLTDENLSLKENLFRMAEQARERLPGDSYSAAMYDFVRAKYESGIPWEAARDSVYVRYQVNEADGYDMTSRGLHCNACFAAGINFAASLVSLFYGEGDIRETIKIAVLAGWDSDNPASTWGGLLGFMTGKEGIEQAFGRTFAGKFNIHRTRRNFPNDGIDTFDNMAKTGIFVVDRTVQEEMGGGVDLEDNLWYIPGPHALVPRKQK
ncbi:MAG: ADP-ribosylglycohydrolase family protein [Marinilabiliales bacterium]|nr:MAG: ADP-ribosylglycohydrolase family protein [Marinilabiliales bacterium]